MAEDDFDFAAIVAVNRPRPIRHEYSIFCGKAAPTSDLKLVPVGDGHSKPGLEDFGSSVTQQKAFGGADVHPRCSCSHLLGYGEIRAVRQSLEANLYHNISPTNRNRIAPLFLGVQVFAS
jgi:hypothetical protein